MRGSRASSRSQGRLVDRYIEEMIRFVPIFFSNWKGHEPEGKAIWKEWRDTHLDKVTVTKIARMRTTLSRGREALGKSLVEF